MEAAFDGSARETEGGLASLLHDARRDSAEFPAALANHAPMVLTMLDRLGACEGRLRQALRRYREAHRLVPVPPRVARLDRDNWTSALGLRTREGDYRDFFDREVADHGSEATIRRFLPRLLPGIGASALHPLMRLAYGLLCQDPREVAAALAYWAACFLALPLPTGETCDAADPCAVLRRVRALPRLRDLPRQDHLWYGIRAVGAEPAFAPVVDWLHVGPETLSRMAASALELYAGTLDFAALHALTGTHWVRVVHAVCPEPLLLRHFWQAVAALAPTIGFPDAATERDMRIWRERPAPPWPAILAAAVASDDEHDISLVFSALEDSKVYGDRLYRVVAARRLGMIA